MSETLFTEQRSAFNSELPYSFENYPPEHEQRQFFRYSLLEAAEMEPVTRTYNGPLLNEFRPILRDTQRKLHHLDPSLTPEHLVDFCYQSPEVKAALLAIDPITQVQIRRINEERFESIDTLVSETLIDRLAPQTIADGTLDTPPYAQQGEGWQDLRALSLCANACFRMVFGGITGWTPSETATVYSLLTCTGQYIADDSEYHKLFKTPIFEEICDKDVTILDIMGADLNSVTTVANKMRGRLPTAQIYCVVSLASATTLNRAIWHTNVLLEASKSEVVCHDPARKDGRPYDRIPKNTFTQRWATAFNRAQLYIATDK